MPPEVREKRSQDSEGREKSAHAINLFDVGRVGELTQEPSSQPRCSERETEEEPGDHPHATWNQLLALHDDGREGRRKNEADENAEHLGPEKVHVG